MTNIFNDKQKLYTYLNHEYNVCRDLYAQPHW